MCISHSSGSWDVQDTGSGRFSVWGELASWLTDGHLLSVSSHGRRCLFQLLVTAGTPWLVAASLQPLLLPSHCLLFSMCQSSLCLPLIRTLVIAFTSYPDGGSDGKESACNTGEQGSVLGLRRSPGWREWLPIPVFLPGEFHGPKSLAGCNPWSREELDRTEPLTHTHTHNPTLIIHDNLSVSRLLT